MLADLHVHTDVSDSSCDLHETLRIARANGVTHIAITNHDTVKGLPEAMIEGEKQGIKVIPGIEISAQHKESGKKVHILGYHIDLEGKNIKKLCDPILKQRHNNSLWQINQLLTNGFRIDIENIIERAKNSGVTYKQHIMAELIKEGYTDSIYSDLYKKLFKNGGICARDIEYADVFDAVRAIKLDGGIAVLAHPGQQDTFGLIDQLVEAGLDGIELYHEDHTKEDVEKVLNYQEKHNLILTGGSDFHGSYGTQIQIGDIACPEEYIDLIIAGNIKGDSLRNLETSKVQEFMEALLKEAGARLRTAVNKEIGLKYKGSDYRDIVTDYDVEIENFLIDKISKEFPGHGFITEERNEGRGFSEYTWIIDPIDGTVNFVSVGKDFSISLALYKNKKPYIGMVYDVMNDLLYSGVTGKGAFLNGEPMGKSKSTHGLKDSLVDMSLNSIYRFEKEKNIPISRLIKYIRGHRACGSASLALCRIARGELQAYISASLSIWDYAAAIIILAELGGSCAYLEEKNSEDILTNPAAFVGAENAEILQELKNIVGNKLEYTN